MSATTSTTGSAAGAGAGADGAGAGAGSEEKQLHNARKYWDAFAKSYADNASAWSSAIAHSLAIHIKAGSCKRVLDLGCGPGNVSALLHTLLPPDCSITAMDLSPAMVGIAKANLAEASKTRDITVVQGNAQTIPGAAANSFDAVISNLCIFMCPNPDAALRRMCEVVKPGGVVAFSAWGLPEESLMFTLFPKVLKQSGVDPRVGQETGSATSAAAAKPPRSNFHMGGTSAACVRERMLAAGFASAFSWHQMAPFPAASGDEFAAFVVTKQKKCVDTLASLPAETAEKVKTALLAAASAVFDGGCPIGLDTLMVIARKA